MKILITGSQGFVGGSVGRYAARQGHQVAGTGRSECARSSWTSEYFQTEISPDKIARIVEAFAPDVLLHAAGSSSVGLSLTDPLGDLRDATLTCAHVLEAVRLSGLNPLIILPSSAAVVGNPVSLPVDESAPVAPISPYGFHKAASELLAREYAECFDLTVVVCRFFSVFGPAQQRLLVWELYQQLTGPDQQVWLDGTGSESRDFLHVDDAASAILSLTEHHPHSNFTIVNVGSGVETNVIELGEQLRSIVADKEILCRGNIRKNDPTRWCADVSRLKALIGSWQPRALKEALSECVAAWQQERHSQHAG